VTSLSHSKLTLDPADSPTAKCQVQNAKCYFTSLCDVCLRHFRQNLLNSSRAVVVFLFLVVE